MASGDGRRKGLERLCISAGRQPLVGCTVRHRCPSRRSSCLCRCHVRRPVLFRPHHRICLLFGGRRPCLQLAPPPCAWLRHARAPSARLRGQAGAIEKIWTAKARGIADKLAPLRWIECDDGERVAVSCRGRLGNEEDLARIVDLTAELATASGLPAVTALRKLSRKRVGGRPDRWDAPREWKVELSTGLRVSIDVQDGRATSAITRNCVSGCVFEVRSGAGASSTDMRLGVPVPDLGSFSIACDGTTTRLAWATLQPDATVLAAGVDFVETLPRNPSQGPFR